MMEKLTTENVTMKISIIGTGYVGLVTGTCFAELGHQVTCIDNDDNKIQSLNNGKLPIYEPALEEMIQKNINAKRLAFTTDKTKIRSSDAVFIAVGTPPCEKSGRADLKYIEKVASEIAPLLEEYKIIVVKSTVPPGTGRRIAGIIRELNPKAKFDMVSNPEFLREGSAVYDFMVPDRIIVGTVINLAKEIMANIYQPFVEKNIPIVFTDIETAEMIKYTANCFLATKIAFVNEIAHLCEKLSANVEKVMEGVGLDQRIGSLYLKPGPGFGGSCFPKDTIALAQIAEEMNAPLMIIESVIQSNERQKMRMIDKIVNACHGVDQKTICILGLSFKANTDDIRDSASLKIIEGLLQKNAKLVVYDPEAMAKAQEVISSTEVRFAKDPYDAMVGADALVIATEWEQFRHLDVNRVVNLINKQHLPPTVIDLRNLLDRDIMIQAGIRYIPLGKPVEELTNVYNTILEVV